MTSVRRALALSFAERYALVAITLLSNILIARLLKPEQIGLYSVSLAVIGIAQVLRDFGIGNFLIQEKNLSDAHIRTAFGISLLIGGSLFVIVYLVAPFAGSFYGDVRMVQTMRISVLNFLVLPFCTISLALLRRDMAFNQLIIVNLVAASIGSSTTISLAYWGFGPNSMAIGAVVGNIATGISAWIARRDRKLLLPEFSEWRTLLNFGGQSSLAGIVTSVSMSTNDLVVGKVLGFYPVAILSRAQGLMNLFHQEIMSAVRGVALPAFAAAYRTGADLETQHIRSIAMITVVAWPFYGMTAIYSLEVLRLLFGPQWDPASPLVPIFCLAGAISSLNSLISTLLIATGRIDLVTRAEVLLQPARFVLIATAAVLFRSVEACALAYLIITTIAMPIFYKFKAQAIPNDLFTLSRNLLSSALVTLTTLSFPFLYVSFIGPSRSEPISLLSLGVVVLIALIVWTVSVILFKHPLAQEPWFRRLDLAWESLKLS